MFGWGAREFPLGITHSRMTIYRDKPRNIPIPLLIQPPLPGDNVKWTQVVCRRKGGAGVIYDQSTDSLHIVKWGLDGEGLPKIVGEGNKDLSRALSQFNVNTQDLRMQVNRVGLFVSFTEKKQPFQEMDEDEVEERIQQLEEMGLTDRMSRLGQRSSHLSSSWAPTTPKKLRRELNTTFNLARQHFDVVTDPHLVKALISPHASTYFSGLCAASVYQPLLESNGNKNSHIHRVIILGPSHKVSFRGIALPDYTTYKTPLGKIQVDVAAIRKLDDPFFTEVQDVHGIEHSIEMQLPFLQRSIANFEIVPLIVGRIFSQEYGRITRALRRIVNEHTLIVVSTDFTHHGAKHRYEMFDRDILHKIRLVDSLSYQAIESKSRVKFRETIDKTGSTIGGHRCLEILLDMVGQGRFRLACYYTSPQMSQARQNGEIDVSQLMRTVVDDDAFENSVSYLGAIFTTEKRSTLAKRDQFTGYEKKALVHLVRATVENELKGELKIPTRRLWPIKSRSMRRRDGAFGGVKTKKGKLQGSIGRMTSELPLYQTVSKMALGAAFGDGRFDPVTRDMLPNLVFGVTVLGPLKTVDSVDEIEIGRHGIVLEKGGKRAVYLPQVAPSRGWDVVTTLEHLSEKAEFPKDGWKSGATFQVFEGFEAKEK